MDDIEIAMQEDDQTKAQQVIYHKKTTTCGDDGVLHARFNPVGHVLL